MKVSKAYSSHFPVLMSVLPLSNGPVLELGTGLYSTPYLHWYCFLHKRKLVSYESLPNYTRFMRQYKDSFHEVHEVESFDQADIEKEWDVVLVDHSPEERRITEIKRLANLAKYIIIHDSDDKTDNVYRYSEIYKLFKYVKQYTDITPNTTILSNFIDVTEIKI